eukprot:CAMPEP_0203803454 /NCGR_PEP_ID=MMETSP0100_2-20121128/12849_1 /ASSEMBLY_ACC=CAM_ASM_000210 /TAXON_ID=96639 /ORGANISM=" , Strain NY0313808BC1" /LENGTH=62 /DNA_ID=CAMNT_0050711185 /DNA_START=750 /DNA_END=938 /DNA_ORIENTATION=-
MTKLVVNRRSLFGKYSELNRAGRTINKPENKQKITSDTVRNAIDSEEYRTQQLIVIPTIANR